MKSKMKLIRKRKKDRVIEEEMRNPTLKRVCIEMGQKEENDRKRKSKRRRKRRIRV